MENILLVEDNKSLSKMIAKLLEQELDVTVDVAHSMKEAKIFSSGRKYFLAILDLNLPDAPNGEVVDFISEKIPSIVLSGNIEKDVRKKIMAKDVIDYVSKGGIADINYLIGEIKRLINNRKHKILVVDDSHVIRLQISLMLKNMFFNVISTAHGEEALGMLKENPDIKIVLTDYHMPVMNGLELTKAIREENTKDELAIIAISGSEDDDIVAQFLKSGANDFVHKPFSKEELTCRVNNTIEALENINKLSNISARDPRTGLYNRRYFTQECKDYYATIDNEVDFLAIAQLEIDDIANCSGEDSNRYILNLSRIISSSVSEYDVCARFSDGEFAILFKESSSANVMECLESIRSKCREFSVCIGYTMQKADAIEDILSAADMALYNASHSGKNILLASE
ncbi:MAG: response regulator [Helicobacteraceae bacterium]|nr:response regulator [Helicobacteraceae bacterium]